MMNKYIKLHKNDVPAIFKQTFPSYKRHEWLFVLADSVEIGMQQWSGGSRSQYCTMDVVSGRVSRCTDTRPWPENMTSQDFDVELDDTLAVVDYGTFRGKPSMTVYLSHDNIFGITGE